MATSRELTDISEIEHWCGVMFNARPIPYLSIMNQYETILDLMGHGIWTLITDVGLSPHYASLWESKHGQWMHSGGYTQDHNTLGMAWGWWAENVAGFTNVILSDSPDLSADIDEKHWLTGDIGRCTYMAWLDGITGRMRPHDIWVSVIDYDTQIIIESQAHIGMMSSTLLAGKFFPDSPQKNRDSFVSLFECPTHGSHYDMKAIRAHAEKKYPL